MKIPLSVMERGIVLLSAQNKSDSTQHKQNLFGFGCEW